MENEFEKSKFGHSPHPVVYPAVGYNPIPMKSGVMSGANREGLVDGVSWMS